MGKGIPRGSRSKSPKTGQLRGQTGPFAAVWPSHAHLASLGDVVHAILHNSCVLSPPQHLPQSWPPHLSRSSLTTQFSLALFSSISYTEWLKFAFRFLGASLAFQLHGTFPDSTEHVSVFSGVFYCSDRGAEPALLLGFPFSINKTSRAQTET